jgi:tRNA threonylcarbamoyladenosine biosynthesis protein TsaE
MSPTQRTFHLHSSAETEKAAESLAGVLRPGDVVLLRGEVGSGKSHFARHLIRHILVEPEDIPSPTFTLVQSYETTLGPLWHADLYRLTSEHDIEELGLADAFEEAICLVEWPENLGNLKPTDALELWLQPGDTDDARWLSASWVNGEWDHKLKDWAP